MTAKEFARHWKEIDKNFNWNRVLAVMAVLNWTWGIGIPKLKDLKKTAKGLLQEVSTGKSTEIGSGGFYARKWNNELGRPVLELRFVVADWETGY